jgi:hypothetical protein
MHVALGLSAALYLLQSVGCYDRRESRRQEVPLTGTSAAANNETPDAVLNHRGSCVLRRLLHPDPQVRLTL